MFLNRFIGSKNYSDQEILEAVRQGNKEVMINLFEKNYREAGRFILSNRGKEKDLTEVMHEVVIYFWERAQDDSYEPAGAVNDVIVHSACSFWMRKKNIRDVQADINPALDLEVPLPEPESSNWHKRMNVISAHLRLLGTEAKEILYYSYFEKWNDGKIAEHLDLSHVEDKKLKTLDKFENILKGGFVKRDLID